MIFATIHDALVRKGYSDDTADAKIAHDIVLRAVRDAGFHDNLTVKGGGRLERVFGDKNYMRALEDPMYAWLDVSPKAATKAVVDCIASLNESAYR